MKRLIPAGMIVFLLASATALLCAEADLTVDGDTYIAVREGSLVGIGTTEPIAKLHVAHGDINIDNDQWLRVGDRIYFGGNGSNITTVNNPVSGGSIQFHTFSVPNEKMRITDSGNVGIGTTDPQAKLHVIGGGIGSLAIKVGHNEKITSEGDLVLDAPAGKRIKFEIGSADKININADGDTVFYGDVGVGLDSVPVDLSAQMELSSTNKGFLLPRLSQDQREAMTTAHSLGTDQAGLMIYNKTTHKWNGWDGTKWLAWPAGQGSYIHTLKDSGKAENSEESGTSSDYNYGYRFKPNKNISLEQLGGKWRSGEKRTVRLYDYVTRRVLREAEVTSGGDWTYVSVPKVNLIKNRFYVVAVRYMGSGYHDVSVTLPFTHGDVTIQAGTRAQSTDDMPTNTQYRVLSGIPDIGFLPGEDIEPPLPPTALTGSRTASDRVLLEWRDASADETGFIIERKVDQGVFAELIRIGANSVTYTDSSVTFDHSYTYRIKSYNDGGESDGASNEVTVIMRPAAPTNLAGELISRDRIRLTWTDNSSIETGFQVERKTDNGAFVQIGSAGANGIAYDDKTIQPGATYTYRVRANRQSDYSNYSNTVVITVPSEGDAIRPLADDDPGWTMWYTNNDWNLGYEFHTSKNGYVTALGGRWRPTSNQSRTLTVRLYTLAAQRELGLEAQQMFAQANVTQTDSSGNEWVYTEIPPVRILSSEHYVVAVRFPFNQRYFYTDRYSKPHSVKSGRVVVDHERFKQETDSMPTDRMRDHGYGSNNGYIFGYPDVKFEPDE